MLGVSPKIKEATWRKDEPRKKTTNRDAGPLATTNSGIVSLYFHMLRLTRTLCNKLKISAKCSSTFVSRNSGASTIEPCELFLKAN